MLGDTKRVCFVSLSTEIKINIVADEGDEVETSTTSFGIDVDQRVSCLIAEECLCAAKLYTVVIGVFKGPATET